MAEGRTVRVLTRDRPNAAHLPDAVAVAEGDVTERASVREAMAGVDRVFRLAARFQVGPGPWNAETARRVNVAGTRNVLELMDELGVSKGVYRRSRPSASGLDPEAVHQRTRWRAHDEVAGPVMAEGLPLVVASLGAVFGPGDTDCGGTPRTGFAGYLEGDLPMVPRGFVLPWDYVGDAAANLQRAMDRGTPSEEYLVAGEPRSIAEVFDLAADLTAIAPPPTVPRTAFRLLGAGAAQVERVARPPEGFESELLRFFVSGPTLVDGAKAQAELDVAHRPLAESLERYLAWEVDQRGLDVDVGQAP